MGIQVHQDLQGGRTEVSWEPHEQILRLASLIAIFRLIPFALIILIAEEVIPLVVMYTPGLLPSTCILPAQKERIDKNKREKQRAYALSTREVFERIRQRGEDSNVSAKQLLDGPALAAISG